MVTLTARAIHGYEGTQYVARIVGLDPKLTFRREQILETWNGSDKTTAEVNTPGLYAVCYAKSKGYTHEVYQLITEVEGELMDLRVGVGKDAAKMIAQRLDLGESIEQIVEVQIDNNGRPKYRIRKKEGKGK